MEKIEIQIRATNIGLDMSVTIMEAGKSELNH